MSSVSSEELRERIELVDDQISRHEVALAFLRKDREQAQITLQVIENFRNWRPVGTDLVAARREDVQQAVEVEPGKPPGTPTVADMVVKVLRELNLNECVGAEPKAITSQIRQKWWPDASSASIGPIMWRMANQGRLVKAGSVYFLPDNEASTPARADASEQQDGVSRTGLFDSHPTR